MPEEEKGKERGEGRARGRRKKTMKKVEQEADEEKKEQEWKNLRVTIKDQSSGLIMSASPQSFCIVHMRT